MRLSSHSRTPSSPALARRACCALRAESVKISGPAPSSAALCWRTKATTSATSSAERSRSTLLTTRTTFLPQARMRSRKARSLSVKGRSAEVTKRMKSLRGMNSAVSCSWWRSTALVPGVSTMATSRRKAAGWVISSMPSGRRRVEAVSPWRRTVTRAVVGVTPSASTGSPTRALTKADLPALNSPATTSRKGSSRDWVARRSVSASSAEDWKARRQAPSVSARRRSSARIATSRSRRMEGEREVETDMRTGPSLRGCGHAPFACAGGNTIMSRTGCTAWERTRTTTEERRNGGTRRNTKEERRQRIVVMLTGLVNIAVFAAFAHVYAGRDGARREFKPCGGDRQRDIARYGWQKRQKVARECCRFGRGCCRCYCHEAVGEWDGGRVWMHGDRLR